MANAQSILRDALTRGAMGVFAPVPVTTGNIINTNMLNLGLSPHNQQHHQQLLQQQQHHQQQQRNMSGCQSHFDAGSCLTGCGMVANTATSLSAMIQTNGNNNYVPLDIDMDALISVPIDYDMDSLIKQELSLEGNLDFNFDNVVNGPNSAQNIVH